MGNDGMSDIGHWTADHVPVEAYDRMRAEKDRLAAELEACKRHHEKSIVKCRQQLRGAVEALREIVEASEHPSLTVRSTSYMGKVARDALHALRGAA